MSREARPMKGASPPAPAVLIIMGVSGCGKSTVGALLASSLRWEFEDADWFHPVSNVDKMHSGIALTDADRWPWLRAVAAWIDKARRSGEHGVIACSALKRRYRDVLIGDRADVRLVYLKGDETLIARRIATRHEHFMPRSLLHSQFEALEEPGKDRQDQIDKPSIAYWRRTGRSSSTVRDQPRTAMARPAGGPGQRIPFSFGGARTREGCRRRTIASRHRRHPSARRSC
jgi:gluconokinase